MVNEIVFFRQSAKCGEWSVAPPLAKPISQEFSFLN